MTSAPVSNRTHEPKAHAGARGIAPMARAPRARLCPGHDERWTEEDPPPHFSPNKTNNSMRFSTVMAGLDPAIHRASVREQWSQFGAWTRAGWMAASAGGHDDGGRALSANTLSRASRNAPSVSRSLCSRSTPPPLRRGGSFIFGSRRLRGEGGARFRENNGNYILDSLAFRAYIWVLNRGNANV
jgi:hypothetical protein